MKQTAVEWLYERFLFAGYAAPAEWKEKAKDMEKEQIKNAYWSGCINSDEDKDAAEYYNETYGDE